MSLAAWELDELAERLAERCQDWPELIAPDAAQRAYRQIWDEPDANGWLIAWCPDHDTGWHDHDDAAASITVLSGRVRELRMRLSGDPGSRVLGQGSTSHVPASAIHRVQHAGSEPAVTVHCYSPPLRRTGTYSFGPRGDLLRAAQSFATELRAEPVLL